MTGLGEPRAVNLLTALVKRRLLRSDTPAKQGALRSASAMPCFYFQRCGREAGADVQAAGRDVHSLKACAWSLIEA